LKNGEKFHQMVSLMAELFPDKDYLIEINNNELDEVPIIISNMTEEKIFEVFYRFIKCKEANSVFKVHASKSLQN